ncbi:hypothetical protein LEN26_004037, partial [Aphanomyces euteiches]
MDDLVELRPTVFLTVPRLLNKMYDKVMTAGRSSGGIQSWLFHWALSTKLANLKQGYTLHALFDTLVFSKIQKKMGLDRCCLLITASAPLASDIMDFYRVLFDFPIFEAYGQSETMAAGTITHIHDTQGGTVGYPTTTIDIKLKSVPEMGYNVTDTVHGEEESTRMPVLGRGEVCFRGPTVFPGYYKEPKKTAEAFDDDGWLLSGDIGVWTLDGRLKIVDRKKNIFKLSQGEYIAPEKIENILVMSPYVSQPFVYGDSLHSVLVAIIVPEEVHLMALAKSLNVPGTFDDVCRDSRQAEQVVWLRDRQGHPVASRAFTVENGLMTPTFKLKRHDAKTIFRHEIAALYEQCGDLVAGHNVHQDLLSLPTALASLSVGVYAILLALSPFSPRLQLPTKYVITLDEETKPGHGPVRWVGTPPKPHATSMLESLQRTVTTKGNNNFLGHRPFDANGTAQAYVWQTYAQVYKRIQNFAAGLAHEKMMEKTADGDRLLCLYMKNRPEWVIGHYASMYLGGFPVALYDTLGLASAQFILNQTLALTVVCTSAEFPAVITAKKDVPTLKFVVLVDAHILSDASVAAAEAVGLKLTTMAQIEALGAQHPLSPVMPKSSDTYCLVYTSGTTGTPKGALMTHMNVLMGIEGDLERLDKGKQKKVEKEKKKRSISLSSAYF